MQAAGAGQTSEHPLHSNIRHLNGDMAWFGLLSGTTIAFLSVYATILGATSFQLSLIIAGPAAIQFLLSLPFGRWMRGRPLVKVTLLSSLWNRAGYLLLLPLPWLLREGQQVWTLILLTLLMAAPGTLLAIGFNALYAEVVPISQRATVVGQRNAILALAMLASSILSGLLLDHFLFPLNYALVFGAGAVGAVMSSYHLSRIRIIPSEGISPRKGIPIQDPGRPGFPRALDAMRQPIALRLLLRQKVSSLFRMDLLRGHYGRFLLAYWVFYIFLYTPSSLFPLAWVQQLNLSGSSISIGNALVYITMLLMSLVVRRVGAQVGNKRLLLLGTLMFGAYPLLTGLARGPWLYWAASLTGGITWALVNSGSINHLMDKVPEDDRPAHMALHNEVLNLGILVGALLGPLLESCFGLQSALFISAGLRLLTVFVLAIWA